MSEAIATVTRLSSNANPHFVFTVPPIAYSVFIVGEKPIGPEGRPVVAIVETYSSTIEIWAGLGVQQRENALRHELWHAWEWQYLALEGSGAEQRCQLFANASQHFDQEYAAQGGRAALAAIEPESEPVKRTRARKKGAAA